MILIVALISLISYFLGVYLGYRERGKDDVATLERLKLMAGLLEPPFCFTDVSALDFARKEIAKNDPIQWGNN